MRRTRLGLAAVSVVVLVIGSGAAVGATFNDPTKANVLREYDTDTATALVGDGTWSGLGRIAANDGAGWNDESGTIGPSDTVSHTWDLAGTRTIGSYAVQFSTYPGTFTVEYWTGSAWQQWDTFVPTADNIYNRTPGAVTTDKVRYLATGRNQQLRLNELQVFVDAGQTINDGEGYNWFTQPGLVAGIGASSHNAVWAAPNGGNANTLRDGSLMDNNELKAQNNSPQNGDRAFVTYTLAQACQMDFAVFGGRKEQGWANWELYTANGAMPDVQGLVDNDSTTIQSAGWTLQYAQGDTVVGNHDGFQFSLAEPGEWEHMLLVWNTQHGAGGELELYATAPEGEIPEPATMALLGLGALAVLRRKRRA